MEKRIVAAFALAALTIILGGLLCCASCSRAAGHVTLYNYSGEKIKSWSCGSGLSRDVYGVYYFYDANGNCVTLQGGIVVYE